MMVPSFRASLRRLLPRQVGPQRIWDGPLKGYTIVTSWHDYPAAILGYTERPLLDWFSTHVQPGETWLDVGAHYGYTAIALCRLVGHSGRVFAFEPMLSTAGYLSQTRTLNGLPQLTIVPCALGAVADLDVKPLPVMRGMVDSTLTQDEWLETIQVANMDWLWPRLCGAKAQIDGVKIDVQGMEIEVLRGMAEMLSQQHPKLVVEVHHGVDRDELLVLIERMGYSRVALPVEPVASEVEPMYIDNRSYAFTTQ